MKDFESNAVKLRNHTHELSYRRDTCRSETYFVAIRPNQGLTNYYFVVKYHIRYRNNLLHF